MDVYVKFLGIPKIYIDNQWIKISKNKLNLIILYILYNENCTRDELSGIFWPDSEEIRAKSNLRNAIYQMKKFIGDDVIHTEGHSFVRVSDEVKLKKDIDIFLDLDNGKKILEIPQLSFMDKMYLKDNNEFNEWVYSVRTAYEKIALNILNMGLDKSIKIRDIKSIERYANKIIEIDSYNENAYRELIKISISNHDFNKGIKIFKEIQRKIEKELEVPLEDETIELYEFMINNKNNIDDSQIREYFERTSLSLLIDREFDKFIQDREFKHIIVKGEIGVGKSKLIEKFLSDGRYSSHILELNQVVTDMEFLALKKMFNLFGIEYGDSKDGFMQLLMKAVNREKKTILYIKNAEFLDIGSLDYFSEILFHDNQKNIFVILEYSKSLTRDFAIGKRLQLLENTISIDVPLLNIHEIVDYIKFKNRGGNEEVLDYEEIYDMTSGNIMFIDEYLNPQEDKGSIIESLINSFSESELDIVKKASIFEGYFEFEYLRQLIDKDELVLLKEIEKLFNKGILQERDHMMRIKYSFLKSMIYDSMPKIYRDRLHGIVAEIYEKQKELDYENCKSLSYHYGRCNNYYKEYFYHLKSLELRLDYYDQFFPTISNLRDKPKDLYKDREGYYREFNSLYEDIKKKRYQTEGENYHRLIMILEFLIGRTMIGGGKREEGILHIDKAIDMAKKADNREYLIKSYIEYIHYGIHRGENSIMKRYIDLARKLIDMEDFYIEYAEVTRLEGLYQLRCNNLDIAEKLLKESIHIYDIPALYNRNIFPMVAANNYLGNLYGLRKEYDRAEEYYKKSIDICLSYDVKKSLDILYADYGYMLFVMGKYEKAEKILNEAITIYDTLGTHWKRTIVESVLGHICLLRGDYKGAIAHVRSGEIFSKKDQKIEELELLNSLKKEIEDSVRNGETSVVD